MAIIDSKYDNSLFRVGIYQICGGILGLALTMYFGFQLPILSFANGLFLVIAIILYLYSIYCGWLVFTKPERGLSWSLINQSLQVIFFSFLGYSYQFSSGILFDVGVEWTDSRSLTINYGFSSWSFQIFGDSKIAFGVNIIALLALIQIVRIRNKLVADKKEEIFLRN